MPAGLHMKTEYGKYVKQKKKMYSNSFSTLLSIVNLRKLAIEFRFVHVEAYSEPCQISKMECFAEIVNGF